MADDLDDPMTPSGDYSAMKCFWDMVDAIMGGAECMRHASLSKQTQYVPGPAQPVEQLSELQRSPVAQRYLESPYLPRFANESYVDYDCRRRHAPFTNIYEEVSDNLAAKPFSKECELDEQEPDDLKALSENIDGQGHNLHVFAKSVFKPGLDKGVSWILVDYTNVPTGLTIAAEKQAGARPYWVNIAAERMLAVYGAFVNGQEIIYHARIHEPVKRQSGYGEECIDRVRVLNRVAIVDPATNEVTGFQPATWELYEKVATEKDGKTETTWASKGSGPITIGIIPLVPFIPVGRVDGSWKVKPAFHDIAYMQVEEFQQESNLKTIKELTAFPMLSGNGVSQPTDANGASVVVPVGPRAVLFAPMGGDGRFGNWTFIEPSAQSLTFLQTDLEKHRTEMRNLGRQPLATANLTVVTTANVSMKAHSAVQSWALLLKDALEQAWAITCMWLKQPRQPVVKVHTDFGVDIQADTELAEINKATWLSDQNKASEFKRRGALSDDFDWEENLQQMAEEQANQVLQPEKMIDPRTGAPIVVTPQHGTLNQPMVN